MTSKLLSIFLLLFIVQAPLAAQSAVRVVEDSIASAAVQSQMKFNVILPKTYGQTSKHYPVLYLLHGFGGGQWDWIRLSRLVQYAEEFEFIIVCPDGKNGWYTNSPITKLNYEDYIMSELLPAVDRRYRTMTVKHTRAIAGLSMGGYGAVKLALKYPQHFHFAASFSGALYVPTNSRPDNKTISETLRLAFGNEKSEHWGKNDPFALIDSVQNPAAMPYLYLSTGKDDNFPRIVERNRALAEKLRSKGMQYEYHELPGGHTWIFWDKEIRRVLDILSQLDPTRQ